MGSWESFHAWADAGRVVEVLGSGADPNARIGALGSTPLSMAAGEGSVGAVEVLLRAGADVEAADVRGVTPLWTAVRSGRRAVVEALSAAGANPWRPVWAGRSAAAVAVFTPLADVFTPPPGAVVVTAAEERAQREADAEIERFAAVRGPDGLILAFVPRPAPEVLAALGAREAEEDDWDDEPDGGLTEVPGGCLVRCDRVLVPSLHEVLPALAGDGVAAAVNDDATGGVHLVLADDTGTYRLGEPLDDPAPDAPPLLWTYRFGDRSHQWSMTARAFAAACALTGVRPVPAEQVYARPARLFVTP